jgi:hypothetical protein
VVTQKCLDVTVYRHYLSRFICTTFTNLHLISVYLKHTHNDNCWQPWLLHYEVLHFQHCVSHLPGRKQKPTKYVSKINYLGTFQGQEIHFRWIQGLNQPCISWNPLHYLISHVFVLSIFGVWSSFDNCICVWRTAFLFRNKQFDCSTWKISLAVIVWAFLCCVMSHHSSKVRMFVDSNMSDTI